MYGSAETGYGAEEPTGGMKDIGIMGGRAVTGTMVIGKSTGMVGGGEKGTGRFLSELGFLD